MPRSIEEIIRSAKKQALYQEQYRKSDRGRARQTAYNKLHNFENKVGLAIVAGKLSDGTVFTEAMGATAINLAREEYEVAFGKLPKNKKKLGGPGVEYTT